MDKTGAKRRPAFALIALLAVFLQAFVVQVHVHGPPALPGAYEQGAYGEDEQHVEAPSAHQPACTLCQTLASAGAATLPSGASAPAAEPASEAAVVALALAPRAHTHSWQSRAPPSVL
ncbi:MAG: hypothetical protein AB7T59_07445 [Hyphomonadaceae bacterium]